MRYELAFIGAGNMAEAIVRGVLSAGLIRAERMIAADPSEARRAALAGLGMATTADNSAAARSAKRILLAVKPQQMPAVLTELKPALAVDALVISIAAGVTAGRIAAALGAGRIVRVMPNTPMLVGAGMSALVPGPGATGTDVAWARKLFDAAGKTIVLADESLMDAVTAVSGSGPAYFFYLVEGLVAAAEAEGLSESDAMLLAGQTCAGAAALLLRSGEPPAELRRRVTSPGGTTQAACELLDKRGVGQAVRDVVRAAAERSRRLGHGS